MRQFFQMDGPVFSFLSKAADLMLLNVMFIITSLPVITIGASMTALSYATLKMKGPAEGYAWRNYLKSFKQNFRQATGIWLIMLAAALILYMDLRITAAMKGVVSMAVRYTAMLGVLIWLMILCYVFPLLSRFENTVIGTIRNAGMVSVANLPRTIAMFVVTGAMVYTTFYNSMTFAYGILAWLVLGFALLSYVNSTFQYKVFEGLVPEEKIQEDMSDNWTLDEPEKSEEKIK